VGKVSRDIDTNVKRIQVTFAEDSMLRQPAASGIALNCRAWPAEFH
jgi:hypothetical protein